MKNFSYKSVINFVICLLLFCTYNCIIQGVPFSLSMLVAFCTSRFSPFCIFLSFLISAFIFFSFSDALLLLISAFFICLVCYLYKLKKRPLKFASVVLTIFSCIPFLLGNFELIIYQKAVYSAIITLFSPIFVYATDLAFVKRFSKKVAGEQVFAFCLFITVSLYGLINFIGLWLVYFLTVFALLCFCYFYKNSRAFIPSIVLALPIALFTKELTVISLYSVYCLTALLFIKKSKLLCAVAVIIVQTAYSYLSGALKTFTFNLIFTQFAPFILFLFLPTRLLRLVERGLKRFDEPMITREIINSERAQISNKLYDLSTAFFGLNNAVLKLNSLIISKQELIQKMCDEVVINICESCSCQEKCSKNNITLRDDLTKLINVGISKGKVNLIDLSRDFSSYCYCTNNVIFEVNRLLEEYQSSLKIREQSDSAKGLLALQSVGVGEALKNLAFELAGKIKFDRKLELDIFNFFTQNGVRVNQIITLKDDVHILFPTGVTDFGKTASLLTQKLGKKMRIVNKIDLGKEILCLFSPAPLLDACFGVCQRTKHGSKVSGDTHSLTRIDGCNFIAVLCDGMGSGENAFYNSQTAISLIEAFFKTGIDKNLSLDLTNQMLSLCSEDSFCALDLAIVDLKSERVNLVKIGGTFGAYISGDEVQIIENNALPLGILQEIAPSNLCLDIHDGDSIVLLSDGVTDAFFSSTDTVDFLQREKCINPQTLAQKLIDFAIDKNGGIAKDDMTALVIKFYKTECA